MHPVVVLLDAISFGGHFSSQKLEEQLKYLKLPVTRVSEGVDLSAAISSMISLTGAV